MSGRMSQAGRGYGRGQSGRGRGRGSRPHNSIFGQRNHSNLKGACEELKEHVYTIGDAKLQKILSTTFKGPMMKDRMSWML